MDFSGRNTNSNKSSPGLALASSDSSSSHLRNNKNIYGSLDDLQAYALQTRNHNLTVHLVEAKQAWETLQASFRANTHARFLYQTTLARIVNHVQDFSDQDDPQQLQLVCDLLKWTEECEHLVAVGRDLTNMSSTTASEDGESGEILPGSVERSHSLSGGSNRTPIIDYADVQIYVDTSLNATKSLPSAWLMNHKSLEEQNDNLEKEIQKWQASMARIRLCNKREASELLTHQKTLRKVVERITNSDFASKECIIEWYERCQKEAERCGSFSERDAAKYCNRCHSKLSSDDGSDGDDDEKKAVNEEEAKTPFPPTSIETKDHSKEQQPLHCPETPTSTTTAASHFDFVQVQVADKIAIDSMEEEEESEAIANAIALAYDEEHQHKNEAAIEVEQELRHEMGSIDMSFNSMLAVNRQLEQEEREQEKKVSAASTTQESKSSRPSIDALAHERHRQQEENDATGKTDVSSTTPSNVAPIYVTPPPTPSQIAAANVEDPPEIIDPKATNLQNSSLVQVKPHTAGCGNVSCCIM